MCLGVKAAGYTCAEVKAAGYTCAEVKAAGYTCLDANAAGYTCAEVKAAGYTCAEAKEAGYVDGLKDAGYALADLKAAGYTYAETVAGGFVEGLKAAGYELTQQSHMRGDVNLKKAGFTVAEAVKAGYALSLARAGFTAKDLTDVGYSKHLKSAGFTVVDAANADFTLKELKECGYSVKEVLNVHWQDDKTLVYTNMKEEYTISDVILADAVLRLKEAGFTCKEYKEAGSLAAMKASARQFPSQPWKPQPAKAGFTIAECLEAGWELKEMPQLGYGWSAFKKAEIPCEKAIEIIGGKEACQGEGGHRLLNALYKGGYTCQDFMTAGLGFSDLLLRRCNFADKGLFTLRVLKEVGYTLEDAKKFGCSAAVIKEAGFSADEAYAAGYGEGDGIWSDGSTCFWI